MSVSNNDALCSPWMDHRNGQQHFGNVLREWITETNNINMGCPTPSLARYSSSETARSVIDVSDLFAWLLIRKFAYRCHRNYKTCKQYASIKTNFLQFGVRSWPPTPIWCVIENRHGFQNPATLHLSRQIPPYSNLYCAFQTTEENALNWITTDTEANSSTR